LDGSYAAAGARLHASKKTEIDAPRYAPYKKAARLVSRAA